MVGFLFNQFFGIRDGGPYVFNCDFVLSAYLVNGHFAYQPTEDVGHWYARAGFPRWISESMMIRSFMSL